MVFKTKQKQIHFSEYCLKEHVKLNVNKSLPLQHISLDVFTVV